MKWLQSLRKENPDPIPAEGPVGSTAPGVETTPTGASLSSPYSESEQNVPPVEPKHTPDVNDQAVVNAAEMAQVASAAMVAEMAEISVTSPAATINVADGLLRRIDELQATQREIGSGQQELRELFENRIRSDEVQGRALEKLHDELKQYKSNFVRQQLLPVLKEVIFCHDFAVREMERMQSVTAAADATVVRTLDVLRQMLADLLFKYDVEPYRQEGDSFDAKTQQCTRTVPTNNSEQDKRIASVLLDGFRSPEGIIRREQVAVYKLAPATNNAPTNDVVTSNTNDTGAT